jgi:hypothetical protein
MPEDRYSIVYRGEVLPGRAPEAVKTAFAQKFRINGGALEALFSGKPVVLKKDLDREAAEKYFRALSSIGAKCSVRRAALPADGMPNPPASAAGAAAATAPLPPRPIEPPPAAKQITCPKCGAIQEEAVECARCGIVFGKLAPAGKPLQTPTDSRLTVKIIARAKEQAKAGDHREAIETLKRHIAQNSGDWKAMAALAAAILDDPEKPDDRTTQADELLQRAREAGGADDADVLRQSARVMRIQGTGDEGKALAEQARIALRARSEKLTDEKQKLDIAKEIDELVTKYELSTEWRVFDAQGALVLQSDSVNDILAGLRDGRVPGDASAEKNLNGIRMPLARATAGQSGAISFLLRPAHMVGIVFMWIAGLVGAAWFSPVALDWVLDYFAGCTEWYFTTFKDAFAYLVLFFLPYFKVVLACCVLVGMAPLTFGFAVGGTPGYMAGYVLGFLLSPFMPKPKRRRTGKAEAPAVSPIGV